MAEPRKNIPPQGATLIATVDNDITLPFWNDVLPLQDPTVSAKAPHKGLALYDEVLRDARARSALAKRKSKLKRRDWTVDAASEEPTDVKAAELVERVLTDLRFDALCDALMDAVLKGFSIVELIWGRNRDGFIVPIGFRDHDQRRFVFDKEWRLRLLTMAERMKGEALPDRKFIVHRFGAKANNPYGLGLGATLYWHVLFKREGVAFWSKFMERFAAPILHAQYPAGTLESEQRKIFAEMKRMVANGTLLTPIGTEIKTVEASRAGNAGYEAWCRFWDEQTAEVVNGETLSTNIKGEGSRAAAETHSEEGHGIVDEDCDDLSGTLNETLLRWITEINFPDAAPPTVWRRRPKNVAAEEAQRSKAEERREKQLRNLAALRAQGYALKDEQVALEEAFDAPLVAVEKETPPAAPNAPGNTDGGDEGDDDPAFADGPDPLAHLIENAMAAGDPAFTAYLDEIEEAFRAASDYDDLSARLLRFAGNRDPLAFVEALGNAMAIAEFEGMADALDETGITASYTTGSKKNG